MGQLTQVAGGNYYGAAGFRRGWIFRYCNETLGEGEGSGDHQISNIWISLPAACLHRGEEFLLSLSGVIPSPPSSGGLFIDVLLPTTADAIAAVETWDIRFDI